MSEPDLFFWNTYQTILNLFFPLLDMQPLSPISVHERYSSPTAGSAKRRLFGEDPPKEILMDRIVTEGTKLKIAPSSSITAENLSISPGQSLLTMATAIVTGTTGHQVTIPLHGNILLYLFYIF